MSKNSDSRHERPRKPNTPSKHSKQIHVLLHERQNPGPRSRHQKASRPNKRKHHTNQSRGKIRKDQKGNNLFYKHTKCTQAVRHKHGLNLIDFYIQIH